MVEGIVVFFPVMVLNMNQLSYRAAAALSTVAFNWFMVYLLLQGIVIILPLLQCHLVFQLSLVLQVCGFLPRVCIYSCFILLPYLYPYAESKNKQTTTKKER